MWDQLRWEAPVRQVADSWITLAAIAAATERLRLGPMVTPLPRRRPVKVARETATLDRLSGGRLTLGVGIGEDRFAREFSKTGEQLDDRARGQMLDEALEILTTAWSGEPVHHHGDHYTVDDIQFLPRPVQRPGVPVWIAGFPGNTRPMRRAARYDGFFPVNLEHPDQLAEVVANVTACDRSDGTVRLRRWSPGGRRSAPVAAGRRHVVAPGVRPRVFVAGRRAGHPPSRTLRTVSTESFGHTDFYDAELQWYNPHFRAAAAAASDR